MVCHKRVCDFEPCISDKNRSLKWQTSLRGWIFWVESSNKRNLFNQTLKKKKLEDYHVSSWDYECEILPSIRCAISGLGYLWPTSRMWPASNIFTVRKTSWKGQIMPRFVPCVRILAVALTAHNWQNWKRVFLTCPCHKIYKDEAVGLKSCKYTWKITIYVNMWNLGQFREILIFCQ